VRSSKEYIIPLPATVSKPPRHSNVNLTCLHYQFKTAHQNSVGATMTYVLHLTCAKPTHHLGSAANTLAGRDSAQNWSGKELRPYPWRSKPQPRESSRLHITTSSTQPQVINTTLIMAHGTLPSHALPIIFAQL
jgi:hypothetical protein